MKSISAVLSELVLTLEGATCNKPFAMAFSYKHSLCSQMSFRSNVISVLVLFSTQNSPNRPKRVSNF